MNHCETSAIVPLFISQCQKIIQYVLIVVSNMVIDRNEQKKTSKSANSKY